MVNDIFYFLLCTHTALWQYFVLYNIIALASFIIPIPFIKEQVLQLCRVAVAPSLDVYTDKCTKTLGSILRRHVEG